MSISLRIFLAYAPVIIAFAAVELSVIFFPYDSYVIKYVLSFVVLCVAIGSAALLARYFTARLRIVRESIAQLARGDMTRTVENNSRDEVGRILDSANHVTRRMGRIIGKLQEIADRVDESASRGSELAKILETSAGNHALTSESIASTVEEIQANVGSVADAVDVQATNVKTVTGSIERLNQMTRSIDEVMDRLGDQTERTSKRAQSGRSDVELSLDAMDLIRRSAERIRAVLEIISGISDRTQLLALNSAIEAARAGDAGRGFSVVSDEISRLADSTLNSVQEISELVHETALAVDSGIEKVQSTAGGFTIIHEAFENIRKQVENANHAIDIQRQDTESILTSVQDVRRLTQEIQGTADEQRIALDQVAAGIGGLATGSQRIAETAERVNSFSTSLKDLSESLNRVVYLFKVEDDTAASKS